MESINWNLINKIQYVYCMGKKLMDRTGDNRSHEFLRQRISVALQRGNACSIREPFPLRVA